MFKAWVFDHVIEADTPPVPGCTSVGEGATGGVKSGEPPTAERRRLRGGVPKPRPTGGGGGGSSAAAADGGAAAGSASAAEDRRPPLAGGPPGVEATACGAAAFALDRRRLRPPRASSAAAAPMDRRLRMAAREPQGATALPRSPPSTWIPRACGERGRGLIRV